MEKKKKKSQCLLVSEQRYSGLPKGKSSLRFEPQRPAASGLHFSQLEA
jgi:hypothetical protein